MKVSWVINAVAMAIVKPMIKNFMMAPCARANA